MSNKSKSSWRLRTAGHRAHMTRMREAKALLAQDFVMPRAPRSIPTVGEVLNHYRRHLRKESSPSLPDVRSAIRCWIAPAFGELRVNRLSAPRILAWRDALIRAGLAPNTIRARYAVLRAAIARAQMDGMVDRQYAEVPRGAFRKENRPAFDAELETLSLKELRAVLFPVDDAGITTERLLLYTLLGAAGLRLGEALDLTFDAIDRRWAPLWRLTISSTWSRKNKRSQRPKTKRVRRVPLHPLLARRLDEWQQAGWALAFGRPPTDRDLVLPRELFSRRGMRRLVRLDDRRVLIQWHRDLLQLELPARRVHALRHTFISLWQNNGASPAALRCITHSPPKRDAFDTYSHLSWEARCNAVLALRLEG